MGSRSKPPARPPERGGVERSCARAAAGAHGPEASPGSCGERLQKIIARAGIASRRAAEELILAGRVSVGGRVVRALGARADPARDRIEVDGERVRAFPRYRYFVFNKPRGVVSTLSDPAGRPCLGEATTTVGERLFPVGRLDADSTGLVLLTNDGGLAARLMHPRYGVPRTYRVKVRGIPDAAAIARLGRGVRLPPVVAPRGAKGRQRGGGPGRDAERVAAARVSVLARRGNKSWLEITVTEGRYHIVRRMCAAVGHPVEKLRRVRLGPIGLGKLPPGGLRELTGREVAALRRATGLLPGRDMAG